MPAFSLTALIRGVLVWLLIITAESVHGALRRLLLNPDLAYALRQLSVIFAVLIVFAIAWLCRRWMVLRSTAEALVIGLLWVILTLAFEFGLGRAMGMSWSQILSGYDLLKGDIMPLGLLATALTPWAVRELRLREQVRLDPRTGDPRGETK